MGNNQALQVGAEAAGALVGGLLAAVDVTVPLVSFGILLVVGGLMLVPLLTPVLCDGKDCAERIRTLPAIPNGCVAGNQSSGRRIAR